jgi:predicted RNase H-like HicB family nuclease
LPIAPARATPAAKRPPQRQGRPGDCPMQRTITYTVLIMKRSNDFLATCPALPHCSAVAATRATAYRGIKRLIRRRLADTFAHHFAIPSDPVVSAKHLRLDLASIREEVDLR